jgi:hypothetical protein
MKGHILAGFILISFFSLIGFSIWYTETAHCLWALLLTPAFKITKEDE